MDSDLDPFADLLPEQAVNKVRVAGKFQPRAKLGPGKATSTSLPRNAKENSSSLLQTSSDVVKADDTLDYRLKSTAGFPVASSILMGKEEILGNYRENAKSEPVNSSTHVIARIEDLDSSDALSLKVDSLQPDSSDPNPSANNRSEEPTSLSLATFSAAKESGNDSDGLCLHELDSVDAVKSENGASDANGGWSSSYMKSTADVGSLELELDPIADALFLPSVGNARTDGKFKPKAKVQLRKEASEAIVVPVSSSGMEEPATVDAVVTANLSAECVNVGGDGLTDPGNSSVTTSENLVTREPLRNEDYTSSGVILSTDPHSGFEKPMEENADMLLGFKYIDDFVSQSPNTIEIPVPTKNNEDTVQQCRFPSQNSGDSSVLRACNADVLDPVSCNESTVRTDDGRLESEESGPFFNVERPDFLSDSTIVYESCSRKFQPKPKVQNGKEKITVTDVHQNAVGSAVPPTHAQLVTSETGYGNEGSIPSFLSDEVLLDYSSMSFSDCIPQDAEFPMNEEQINILEACQSSDANIVYQENTYGITENKGDEGDKSSRHLRKRKAAPQTVEEPEDEALDNDSIPSEPPSSIADDDNDYDYRVDEDHDAEDRSGITSQKKRSSKKSQIPSSKKQNPGRRRKSGNDAQEHSTQVPQKKKFSHSTRRKNRLKDLLSIPEDEVDFRRLPVKDIILLAGYKESLAVKEAKASKNASTVQSSKNSVHGEESLHEEDNVASEQDGGYAEDQSNLLFNHNSFMDKTPKSRWSKQDTELFYEGIRRFGTDLSMIQQLFPGKTRHQMKLKYKKEERQHPLRLSEALGSRSKDNSYFEKVIEQLKKVAGGVEHEYNRDVSAGASDEEAGSNPEARENNAKTELEEDVIVEDHEGDVGGVESPKYYEEEVDVDDVMNSYIF